LLKIVGDWEDTKGTLEESFKTRWMKNAKWRLPSKDPSNLDDIQWHWITLQPTCSFSIEKHPHFLWVVYSMPD